MQEIQELIGIIRMIIREQDENILNVRGGRGYSVGHPYPTKSGPPVNQNLGNPGPYEEEDNTEQNQTGVKISRAFKRND